MKLYRVERLKSAYCDGNYPSNWRVVVEGLSSREAADQCALAAIPTNTTHLRIVGYSIDDEVITAVECGMHAIAGLRNPKE